MLDLVDKGELSREDYHRLATADFQGRLEIRHCASHYYSPLAMAVDGRADWIRHVVREKSEVQFLRALENWLAQDPKIGWDFWMFSKLDEATDSVYIPYQDTARNQQRKFKPTLSFGCGGGGNTGLFSPTRKARCFRVGGTRRKDGSACLRTKLFRMKA